MPGTVSKPEGYSEEQVRVLTELTPQFRSQSTRAGSFLEASVMLTKYSRRQVSSDF